MPYFKLKNSTKKIIGNVYPQLTPFFILLILNFPNSCPASNPTPHLQDTIPFQLMATEMSTGAVEDISTQSIENNFENYLLLDTRAKSEYNVSHLPNARWVGYLFFSAGQLKDVPKDTPIIVYCSVGYRSERIGEKLLNAGFANVQNLYGGIFDWVNEGCTVVDEEEKPTNRVHGYSREWGKWIRRGEVVY